MLEDRDGRSKGCAVVEFKHREGANKCIDNMHRTELHDRLIIAKEIRVNICLNFLFSWKTYCFTGFLGPKKIFKTNLFIT